jgi:hypothetical protein
VFRRACKMGLEGIVLGSVYRRSGPLARLAQVQNPAAQAVKLEAEEDWNGRRWQ